MLEALQWSTLVKLTFVVFIGEAGTARLEGPAVSGWDKLAAAGSLSIRDVTVRRYMKEMTMSSECSYYYVVECVGSCHLAVPLCVPVIELADQCLLPRC